jgi:ABC-2 type transport system ATP-binding protein
MGEMIEIRHLAKYFGPLRAVEDVTFSMNRGEVLGFLGPNGAGKSTTMKMITGFLAPSAGTAIVGGFDVQLQPIEVKRRIGYLPEGAPAYPDMTPKGFLEFVARMRGFGGAEARGRIDRVVERVTLAEVMHQPIETLSKGFKRRVGLAQALLHDPEILVLDEPTDGLDPNQKHEVRRLIAEMAPEKAIIISTHILEEVDAVCTRAVIIARGRILADGTPAQLEARSPHHNAVRMSFADGEIARAASEIERLPVVARVEREDSVEGPTLVVFPRDAAPPLAELADLARAHGWQLTGLRVERGRLDDVFREITAGNRVAEAA